MFETWFLRHPAVDYPPGRCYGRLDVPLARGWEGWAREQAEALRSLCMETIWSSPAKRCAEVANALAERLGLEPRLDARLLELDFGEWEGRRWDDIDRAALDRWAADPSGFRAPGGESGAELIARAASFAAVVAKEARFCIVVSHGGPLRLLPALLRDEPVDLLAPSPAIGSLVRVRVG